MEKEILVLIKMSKSEMLITAVEKYNSSTIEIFSDSTIPQDMILSIDFLKSSIKKIEELISAKINSVSVMFDATNKAKIKQKIISEKIFDLKNREISKNDFLDSLIKVKDFYKKNNFENEVPILFQPFQFNITEENSDSIKSYHKLPLGKKAEMLEILFSVTTLNKAYYDSIVMICKKAKLKITQIYSSSNTSPYILYNNLNKNISITLEVEKNYSNLIISNNGITIVTKNLEYCYEDLQNKIAKELRISKKIVDVLIVTEGIITKDINLLNKVIFHKKNQNIKARELTLIIKSFIKTLIIEIDEFIKANHSMLKIYTLNIIGKIEKIEKIEEYCKSILNDSKIEVNKRPIHYMLLDYSNRPIFGLLKMMDNIKKITNEEINNTRQNTIQQKNWLKPIHKRYSVLSSK